MTRRNFFKALGGGIAGLFGLAVANKVEKPKHSIIKEWAGAWNVFRDGGRTTYMGNFRMLSNGDVEQYTPWKGADAWERIS